MSERPKYQQMIFDKISTFETGYVFSTFDFTEIAEAKTINKSLERLSSDGKIRKIIHGIYDNPLYSELLGEYMVPRVENVAACLARKYHWTIAPAGNTALNELRISTQVPVYYQYVSDGPYRSYMIGNRELKFRHVMPKEIVGYHRITIMVIQGIRALGQNNITPDDISKFRAALLEADREILLSEGNTSAEWIRKIIKQICEE